MLRTVHKFVGVGSGSSGSGLGQLALGQLQLLLQALEPGLVGLGECAWAG